MRALIGLGNPGEQFSQTRHNVGSLFLDFLAEELSIKISRSTFNYQYTSDRIDDKSFILVKPNSAVGLSGFAIKKVIAYHNLQLDDVMVVYDDMNLEFGEVRLRLGGGDGGHKGIRSTMSFLDSNKFPRLRIGIGKPGPEQPVLQYVLSPFTSDESERLKDIFIFSAELMKEYLKYGLQRALNLNSKLINEQKQYSGVSEIQNKKQDSLMDESGDN